MNRILLVSSLGLSAVALAVGVWPRTEPSASPAPVEAPSPDSASADAPLRNLEIRLKNLEESSQVLARRLMALEHPGTVTPGAAPASGDVESLARDVARLRDEVRSLTAGEALHSEGGKAYLKSLMKAVEQELDAEQRQARLARWRAQQQQAVEGQDTRWRAFVTDARLDFTQEQVLQKRLQAEADQREQALRALTDGTRDPRAIRREVRALERQTDAEMKKVLSAEQWAKFRATRREERRPNRGP